MIGQQIGNYKITALLGEGGMGQVYLGEHPLIGSKVAIKVLHAELGNNPEIVSRFFTEARAVNDIRHPNIVQISDFGESEGRSYIVMELLEGQSLSDRLKATGPLPEPQAASIAAGVAGALGAAHSHGIIHRDLKPDNVFLMNKGGREEVKVLDFGIAKLIGDPFQADHKTQTGSVIGTPHYMSPEQCLGKKDIDGRSDIYSLGIVLYEMAVGALPFSADTLGEVIVAHTHQPPPPPRERNPGLSTQMEAVILHALAKDRDQRYATMQDLSAALQEIAEGRVGVPAASPVHPTVNKPPGADDTPRPTTLSSAAHGRTDLTGEAPPSSRRGLLIAGAGLAVVAAVVISVVLASGGDNPTSAAASPPDAGEIAAVASADAAPAVEPATADASAPVEPDKPPPAVELIADPVAEAFVGDRTLGKTPVKVEVPADGAAVEVILRRAKYKDKKVELAAGGDETIKVALERSKKPPKRGKPPRKKPPKSGFTVKPIE